jgi:hypothetical protein
VLTLAILYSIQDTWFSYARLEEDAYRAAREDGEQLNPDKVRDVYERAVAQVPPGAEKRLWRRYIFLWLFYATFEEIETKVRGSSPRFFHRGSMADLDIPFLTSC